MKEIVLNVDVNNSKQRLDVFLEMNLSEFSRSHYKKQIENAEVLVNNKIVKAGYKLKVNDEIKLQIKPPKEFSLVPQDIEFEIVYEDNDLLVINKPQGMVVHPAAGNYDKTLVNALLYKIKNLSGINGAIRPGIVHRLDKNTSGLMLVAKNDKSHINLSRQIQSKECKRFYLALIEGNVKAGSGVIETFISRSKTNKTKMAVNFDGIGKSAITHYVVKERFNGYTLCEFELKTGRTHQIRVHSAYMGHPVVGDGVYNKSKCKFKSVNGQLLHSYKISFNHPSTNKLMEFEIGLPDYFTKILNTLIKI